MSSNTSTSNGRMSSSAAKSSPSWSRRKPLYSGTAARLRRLPWSPRRRDRERERFRGLREAPGHGQRERSGDEEGELVGIVERAAREGALREIDRLASREATAGLLGCPGR